jgi:hypothetical protein
MHDHVPIPKEKSVVCQPPGSQRKILPTPDAPLVNPARMAPLNAALQSLVQMQQQQGNRQVVRLARRGGGNQEITPEVESAIRQQRGGGQALDHSVRGRMESAFGADFKGVRVHVGDEADRLNQSLNARAFTTGRDIFFRQGEYSPGSVRGKELLAHELTHVMQQRGGLRRKLTLGQPGDRYEEEADRVAREVVRRASEPESKESDQEQNLQRQEMSEEEEDESIETSSSAMKVFRKVAAEDSQITAVNPYFTNGIIQLTPNLKMEQSMNDSPDRNWAIGRQDLNSSPQVERGLDKGYEKRQIASTQLLTNVIQLQESSSARQTTGEYIPGGHSNIYKKLESFVRKEVDQEVKVALSKENPEISERKLNPDSPQDRPLIRIWLRKRDEILKKIQLAVLSKQPPIVLQGNQRICWAAAMESFLKASLNKKVTMRELVKNFKSAPDGSLSTSKKLTSSQLLDKLSEELEESLGKKKKNKIKKRYNRNIWGLLEAFGMSLTIKRKNQITYKYILDKLKDGKHLLVFFGSGIGTGHTIVVYGIYLDPTSGKSRLEIMDPLKGHTTMLLQNLRNKNLFITWREASLLK